jgi:hypothetical protein
MTGVELHFVFPPHGGVERLQLLFVSKPCCSSMWKGRTVVPTDIQIFTLGQGWQFCNKIDDIPTVIIWDNTDVLWVMTTQKSSNDDITAVFGYHKTEVLYGQDGDSRYIWNTCQTAQYKPTLMWKLQTDQYTAESWLSRFMGQLINGFEPSSMPMQLRHLTCRLCPQIYVRPHQLHVNAAPSYHTTSGCSLQAVMCFWCFNQTNADSTPILFHFYLTVHFRIKWKNNQQMHCTYLFNFYSAFPRHVSA